jgi:hypothetical protein
MSYAMATSDKNYQWGLFIRLSILLSFTLIAYLLMGWALAVLSFMYFYSLFESHLQSLFFKYLIGLSFDDRKGILSIKYHQLFTIRLKEVEYSNLNYQKPKWNKGRYRNILFFVGGKKFIKVSEKSSGWSRSTMVELAKAIDVRNLKKWEY